jgi:hypothetical protein
LVSFVLYYLSALHLHHLYPKASQTLPHSYPLLLHHHLLALSSEYLSTSLIHFVNYYTFPYFWLLASLGSYFQVFYDFEGHHLPHLANLKGLSHQLSQTILDTSSFQYSRFSDKP